ncbi:MAG TPA: hypothetical protein VK747_20165 [Blastocatellia bacterium]|nr:hypothetical protein [Blastocatellia bacterium]
MSKSKITKRIKQILFLLTAIAFSARAASARQSPSDQLKQGAVERVAGAAVARGENRESLKRYKGENGILSAKTVIFGGEFRVTTVIPFKGNFAEYHHLEVARPVSLVGRALTPDVASRQVDKFKSQFESRRLFETVTVIDAYDHATASQHEQQPSTSAPSEKSDDIDSAESLDAPMGNFDDLIARDKRRALGEDAWQRPAADKTLVVVIEVLDYAKGSRWKQALPLDLSKSILTVRLRYYEKSTGEEVGRQIISGQSDGSSLLGPLSPRDGLSGVADGFIDQVTRRVVASEK